MRLINAGSLPNPAAGDFEPRGALWVEIDLKGIALQVINTHLAVSPTAHRSQLEGLLGESWLISAMNKGPAILCGDFNFGPRSPQYRRLCEHLVDAQAKVKGRAGATWFSWRPLARIDHILHTTSLRVTETRVQKDQLARNASDHLPLVADIVAVSGTLEPQTTIRAREIMGLTGS